MTETLYERETSEGDRARRLFFQHYYMVGAVEASMAQNSKIEVKSEHTKQ